MEYNLETIFIRDKSYFMSAAARGRFKEVAGPISGKTASDPHRDFCKLLREII